MPSKLALGSIALSLSHVWSSRQKIVEIAGVTPGAADAFNSAVTTTDIQAQVIQKIKDGFVATQTKLDQSMANLESAGGTADQAKKAGDEADQANFECVAEQQRKLKTAEDADEALENAKEEEQKACQLQEDNKGFAYSSDVSPSFECDHGVAGQCDDAIAGFEAELNKMSGDASSQLGAAQEHYNALKAACDKRKEETVAAQGVLTAANDAFHTQKAQCETLNSDASVKMCSYGTAVQAKCVAEGEFQTLVAATNEANDKANANSEVDRIQEWISAATTKCMLGKSAEKGLGGALDSEDLNQCQATEAQYAEAVGTLDRHDGEFKQVSGSNPCADGPISFFNGQAWNQGPRSTDYSLVEFRPALLLDGTPFFFCEQQK